MIKNLPTVQETQVQPLEKEMTTHSRILAWEIPWIEEPGGLWSMGLQRVRYSWVTNTHRLGKGGTEKLSKLLKVTQMVTSKARIWSDLRPEFMFRFPGLLPRNLDSVVPGWDSGICVLTQMIQIPARAENHPSNPEGANWWCSGHSQPSHIVF